MKGRRKTIIKGRTPKAKKIKYLNQFELHTLIAGLDIKEEVNWDWFILLVTKTGKRQSPHCVTLLFFEKIYA